MTCWLVRQRLSNYLDGGLPSAAARRIATHVEGCSSCAGRARSLRATVEALVEMPRLSAPESIAALVLSRIEGDGRGGPGLAFRSFRTARPLILPSLVSAACLLALVLGGVIGLDRLRRAPVPGFAEEAWDSRLADSGSETNPLFPSSEVNLPQARGARTLSERGLDEVGEGTFFLETVVARDGSVSAVTLLEGDSVRARFIVDALRRERFEPVRLNGRRVAVSVYRLVSHLEVRAPLI